MNKAVLCFVLGSYVVGSVKAADPVTFFGGTDDEDYLVWVGQNDAYDSKLFLQSASDDLADGVAVHWTIHYIDEDEPYVDIGVAARATGWVGFGLSENGGMTGSDMFIFQASSPDTVLDAYVTNQKATPLDDDCQDWILLNSTITDEFIMVQVRRKLITGDSQDLSILNDADYNVPASRIISAWGDSETLEFHGTNRARGAIRWFSSVADEATIFRIMMNESADSTFVVGMNEYPVEPVETVYVDLCVTGNELRDQGVPLDDGVAVVGFETIATSKYLHHITVYGSFAENNEANCTLLDYINGALFYIWAPGDPPIVLPEYAGAPFGGDNGFRSVLINYHYNNPELLEGELDSSGVHFYYSETPREYDIGMLQLGDPFVGLVGLPIGDGTAQHGFDCTSACSVAFLEEPVTVIREILHMHESGYTMMNQQYRNGSLQREGVSNYFAFEQQGGQAVIQQPFEIYPGDSFKTTCYYRNDEGRNRTFGLGSQEEMCIAFLMYYPLKKSPGGNLPWTCGVGLGSFIPGCESGWDRGSVVTDDSSIERTFGAPLSTECPSNEDLAADPGVTTTSGSDFYGWGVVAGLAIGFSTLSLVTL